MSVAAKSGGQNVSMYSTGIKMHIIVRINGYLRIVGGSANMVMDSVLTKEWRTFGALDLMFPVCKGVVFFDADARDCTVAEMPYTKDRSCGLSRRSPRLPAACKSVARKPDDVEHLHGMLFNIFCLFITEDWSHFSLFFATYIIL